MLQDFSIGQFLPRFIMNDANGYAVAMALQAAVSALNEAVANGVAVLTDPAEMPEWRLDELAWEYDIPYDYTQDVETKRLWIQSAWDMSRIWGTPAGIEQYLAPAFGGAEVIEDGAYPFWFDIRLNGTWSDQKMAWALAAAEKVKNVRSRLLYMQYDVHADLPLRAGFAVCGAESADMHAAVSGIPESCYGDENGDLLLTENGYPIAG